MVMTNTAKSCTVTAADALRLLSLPSPVDEVKLNAGEIAGLLQLADLGLVEWGFDAYGERFFEITADGRALVACANEAARTVIGAALFDRAFG